MASDRPKLARWFLDPNSLHLDALEEHEDGTVSLPVEVVRPGGVNRFNVTPKLVADLASQPGADLVDTHDADLDGMATHVGGAVEKPCAEDGSGALVATMRTFLKNPLGDHFASLFREHIKAIKEGGKPIVAVSVGVTDLKFAEGHSPEEKEAPWDVIGGRWDHVMVTRAGYQAQPNAGIRATLDEAFADALGIEGAVESDTLLSGDEDEDSSMPDENPLQGKLDAAEKTVTAKDAELTELRAKLEATEKSREDSVKAAETLQAARDEADKVDLIGKIEGVHKKMGTEIPKVKREDGSEVELVNATLDEVRPFHLAALEAFAEKPPREIAGVPPKEAAEGDKSGPAPLKGLFDDVPRKTTNDGGA